MPYHEASLKWMLATEPSQSSMDDRFYNERISRKQRSRIEHGARLLAEGKVLTNYEYYRYYRALHEIGQSFGPAIMDAVAEHAGSKALEGANNDV
jgi:hypothetical protein